MMTTQAEQWELQKKAYQSAEIANELRARAAREDERAAEYRKQLGQDAGTEVEELAETLNDSAAPYYYPFDWTEVTGIAASLLAAGYRKTWTITTVGEMSALPAGSVVLDRSGMPLHLTAFCGWAASNGTSGIAPAELERDCFPATVLHVGATK